MPNSQPVGERVVVHWRAVDPSRDGRDVTTDQDRRRYDDDVTERLDPRGRPYYWIGGGPSGHDDLPASDCNAVAAGMISVTPMHLDLTARAARAVASDPVAAPAWVVPGFQAAP